MATAALVLLSSADVRATELIPGQRSPQSIFEGKKFPVGNIPANGASCTISGQAQIFTHDQIKAAINRVVEKQCPIASDYAKCGTKCNNPSGRKLLLSLSYFTIIAAKSLSPADGTYFPHIYKNKPPLFPGRFELYEFPLTKPKAFGCDDGPKSAGLYRVVFQVAGNGVPNNYVGVMAHPVGSPTSFVKCIDKP